MFKYFGRGPRVRGIKSQPQLSIEKLEERIVMSGVPPRVTDVAVSSSDWSPAFLAFLDPSLNSIGGYRIPTGSTAQTAALPWNNLNQIRIRFDEDVDVQAADLALTGKNVASYAFDDFFYDPQTRVATWTLGAPIAKDKLQIDLDANGIDPVTDVDGNVLNGEWNNNVSPSSSGNESAGGDFEFLINVLPGESNNTSQVTTVDYLLVRSQDGKATTSLGYNSKYDVNGSGTIDSADWQFVQAKIGNSLPAGNPIGVGNDAPTVGAFPGQNITDSTANSYVSLWNKFGDAESGASGLTYSIAGNSAPSLFDSVSINSATGQLVVNAASGASGRANIGVIATDPSGISTKATVPIDVGYVNQAPVIYYQHPAYQSDGTWRFSGTVADDADVSGLIVEFSGLFKTRVAVFPDGTFEFDITLGEVSYEIEEAITHDYQGLPSNVVSMPVGLE